MAAAVGNLPVPSTGAVTEYKPKEIMASYSPPPFIKGRTIKKVGGGGAIAAGTVLARETATKKWIAYNNGGGGGAEVAKGVLLEDVDTTAGDVLGNIVFEGQLKYSLLVGLDANGIADLNGRVDTDADLFIF